MDKGEKNNAVGKDKRKKVAWKEKDELLLIELWEERIHELRGSRKNSHVYEDLSKDLQTYGCVFSAHEIKTKLHNLTNRYRKEKADIGPSGGSPSSWNLYDKIHSILGSFKINNVEHLVFESMADCETSNSYENVEVLLDEDFYDDMSQSSPSISDVSTPVAPEKKEKKNNFQKELLNKIDHIGECISQQVNEIKEKDAKMYELELKKTDLMEKFVKNAEEYKNAFIPFLNK